MAAEPPGAGGGQAAASASSAETAVEGRGGAAASASSTSSSSRAPRGRSPKQAQEAPKTARHCPKSPRGPQDSPICLHELLKRPPRRAPRRHSSSRRRRRPPRRSARSINQGCPGRSKSKMSSLWDFTFLLNIFDQRFARDILIVSFSINISVGEHFRSNIFDQPGHLLINPWRRRPCAVRFR